MDTKDLLAILENASEADKASKLCADIRAALGAVLDKKIAEAQANDGAMRASSCCS